jgi:hypothetical protein
MIRWLSRSSERKLAPGLLRDAERERSAEDLQCALIIGFVFGFSPVHQSTLCRLVDADWHFRHQDVVSVLQDMGMKDRDTIDALFRVTQTKWPYLDYDESRALATKAIWALGNIANDAADAELRFLAESDEPRLRDEAVNQLRRRGESGV